MSLPIIGAALTLEHLPQFRDWLFEKNRDLELQSFIAAETLEGDWRPQAAEALRLLDGHQGRLGIHGPFWGLSLANPDRDIRALVARRMHQGLDVCEALGATQMVIHSPFGHWGQHHNDMRPNQREAVYASVHDTLDTVLARALDQGVTLVMENIEDINPLERLHLTEHFNTPALRLSVDTGHAHYVHCTHKAPPVDYFIRQAGNLLEHVHLQDVDGYADRHWALGEGAIRWAEVFRTLASLTSNPRLLLELAEPTAGIEKSMTYLTEMGIAQ